MGTAWRGWQSDDQKDENHPNSRGLEELKQPVGIMWNPDHVLFRERYSVGPRCHRREGLGKQTGKEWGHRASFRLRSVHLCPGSAGTGLTPQVRRIPNYLYLHGCKESLSNPLFKSRCPYAFLIVSLGLVKRSWYREQWFSLYHHRDHCSEWQHTGSFKRQNLIFFYSSGSLKSEINMSAGTLTPSWKVLESISPSASFSFRHL